MRQTKILTLFIIILCFNQILHGQIDTNKRYIEKLVIKSDLKIKTISILLKNKTSELKFNTDSIINVAFFKNDTISLKVHINDFEFNIENFNSYFNYCVFSHKVEININNQKTSCTQIYVFDGSGNEYGYPINCPDHINSETPMNYISILTFGNINKDQKQYQVLGH